MDRWHIPSTASIDAVLDGAPVTIKSGARELSRVENRIVAAPAASLKAAGMQAHEAGWTVHILGDAIEGEASEVARDHAARALDIRASLKPQDPPVVLLSGGECTVTNRGSGTGGPNAEFCLALALALDGAAGIAALACDTDGDDGAAEFAGAVIEETTLSRAAQLGLDPATSLAANDSHSFFARLGDQVITGPTLTNVNDFRAVMIQPHRS